MTDGARETDILIVGAGPVGLFLANECARRGLRWQLLESRAAQSETSKALAIFPRTLEILDMAGLVEPFMAVANRVTSVAVITHGHTLARMRFAPEESPYPLIAMVPQNVTEQLLLEALRRKDGAVEYETTLVSAVQQDGCVTSTLEHRGHQQQIRSAFVVGCDGAHSAVRHLLDLPFEGAQYDQSFMLADIQTDDTLPADQLQLCPSEFGPLAIFPMSATRRRIVATVAKTEQDAPSLAFVRDILAERAPSGIHAAALHWSSYFRVHHRQAATMRVGRMFIAGDAAHIHSPFGGQGMNTGLHDVWNLAWKLDLVLRGRGNESLLDSYSTERQPVIAEVIRTTDLLTRVMGTPNRFVQLLRNAVIPMVSRLAPFQHAFVQRLSELGIAYRGSPIVEGDGRRYFDESLRGGGIGRRFVLVIGDAISSTTRTAVRALVDSHADVLEMRSGVSDGLTLVRPDGYVAFSADGDGGAAALEALQGVLSLQTTSNGQPPVAGSFEASPVCQ